MAVADLFKSLGNEAGITDRCRGVYMLNSLLTVNARMRQAQQRGAIRQGSLGSLWAGVQLGLEVWDAT